MRQKLEIYPGRELRYEKELIKLEQCKTSKRNKELLTAWHNSLFASGCGSLRVAKLSTQTRKIVLHLGKDLDKLTKQDIESLIAKFNRYDNWAEATKADYRRCLKQFLLWYKEEDPEAYTGNLEKAALYRYVEKQIKTTYAEKEYDYSETIHDEDIYQVLDKGCSNTKEKAFLAVLHESGFRAGEILNIQLRDIQFMEDRIVIQVDGKTGRRRVPLVTSMGYLARWLDEHPFKDNDQAHVWLGHNPRHKWDPIRHIGAQKLVDRCFERAEVKKRHNLHWFRHSRATLNAPHMPEVILCKYFGWAIGSKQVRRYVHANVGQVEDSIMKMHGLKKQEETQTVKRCACGMNNDPSSRYCHRCGKALSVHILEEDNELKNKAIEEALKFLADNKYDLSKKLVLNTQV